MAVAGGQVMQQSHSMPSGVDHTGLSGSTPEHKKSARNVVSIKIQMLDGTITVFQVQHKAIGRVLFDQVCKMLNLLESDYFGLEYCDQNKTKYWLDYEKQMNRQIGLTLIDPVLRFCVKFYTPDPAQLEEPYTRYLFALQIKQDMAEGYLQCNDNTSALMASYIIQAECGDFMDEDYPDHSYLSSTKFVPHQDADMERRIIENYRKHKGQTPEVADLNLLEIARRCELYGIKMSKAKDHEGVPLSLAVVHMGILVFQNFTKINTFSWAKIRKLSFKKKRFLIKLQPEGYGYYKDTVEFYFEGRNECKNFWKKCIEHHGFFRCPVVRLLPRQKTRVFSRGSSFRYSGKTQKEVVDYVRSNFIKRQPFQRSASFKITRTSGRDTHQTMGRSISTHLPISESEQNFAQQHNAASTPVSQSCGSVTLTDKSGDDLSPTKELPPDTPTFNGRQKKQDAPPPAFDSPPPDYADVAKSPFIESLTIIPETTNNENAVPPPAEDVEPVDPEQPPVPASEDLSPNETPTEDAPSPTLPSPSEDIQISVAPAIECLKTPSKQSTGNQAYFILKELLMTERTFKKNLEVLSVWFKEAVSMAEGMPEDLLSYLFSHIDPIAEFHDNFLLTIEQRLTLWEGKLNAHTKVDCQKIGDIMIANLDMLKLFKNYSKCHVDILDRLHACLEKNKRFELVYKMFEMQKMCYLPLTVFILKPAERLVHYQLLLEMLLQYYPEDHLDFKDCQEALEQIQSCTASLQPALYKSQNGAKLLELQRDLLGFDEVIKPQRRFIREGSLQKYSKKGFQQRIFFLFSDVLVYANKVSSTSLQFKVHGNIPINGMVVEPSESKLGANYCFTIYGGNQALLLAASTENEKTKWIADLSQAISDAEYCGQIPVAEPSDEPKNLNGSLAAAPLYDADTKQNVQRSNTTVQVCWHRSTSVGMDDFVNASQNHLSGYLLRKFKNSNGWQKLWVVFTDFCLFFYKSYQNDFPLASLPLLGYSVTMPSPVDGIKKEFVFKLQFKYHVYFFRAESEYAFNRWMDVIQSATVKPEPLAVNGNNCYDSNEYDLHQ